MCQLHKHKWLVLFYIYFNWIWISQLDTKNPIHDHLYRGNNSLWPNDIIQHDRSILIKIVSVISLRPSDAIWRHRSGSTLAKVKLVAWWHQANTWTNVDWSSVKSSDIHIRAISQEMPQPSIPKMGLKITYLKFHSNFSGANELKAWYLLSTKPLLKPMLSSCQLDKFPYQTIHLKMTSASWLPFCLGLNMFW